MMHEKHQLSQRFDRRPVRRPGAAVAPGRPGGRPRSVNLHDIVDAILYVNRTACQWRALPKDYPPWSTAYDYFRK